MKRLLFLVAALFPIVRAVRHRRVATPDDTHLREDSLR